jgi:hypothetical protein
MKRLAALLAPLLVAHVVHAADWVLIGKAKNHTDSLDASPVRRDEMGHLRVWTKSEFSPGLTLPNGQKAASSMTYYVIDCNEKSLESEAGRFYSSSGTVVGSWDTGGPLQYAAPDSVAEAITEATCATAQRAGK